MSGGVTKEIEKQRQVVDPSEDEITELSETAAKIKEELVSMVVDDCDFAVDVVQTGSTSRMTWVSGDHDIDMFVRFEESTKEDEMEEIISDAAFIILDYAEKSYASHPYVKGTLNNFEVDIVPCIAISQGSQIKTAVDRTPLHTRYIQQKVNESLASDVRVAKQFLKGCGVYGSDVATQGFSGFLTELLIIEYDGFENLLESVVYSDKWKDSPIIFDPENHSEFDMEELESPLLVVDPTDPERNVAANVSKQKLSEFKLNAQMFLSDPRQEVFNVDESADVTQRGVEWRGTNPLSVVFKKPEDVVEDTLVPQLQKSLESIEEKLNEYDFRVFDSYINTTDESCVLLFEMSVSTLPEKCRHMGPPVDITESVEDFVETYEDDYSVDGPFVDGENVYVIKDREFSSAKDFLRSEYFLSECAFGSDVEDLLHDSGWTVREEVVGFE